MRLAAALALVGLLNLPVELYAQQVPNPMSNDAGNAKRPEVEHNLGLMASIVPQKYGAKGDGTTDDTVAVQAWLTDLKTGNFVGNCQGKFRLTASVNAFPAAPYRVVGAGQGDAGCNFYIDYNSNWAGNAIDLTNPVTPTTRGSGADWSSLTITYNAALTSPPAALGGDNLTDDLFRDILILQYTSGRGTCLHFDTPWNLRQFKNISVWGCGGHVGGKLVPAGTSFTIAAASTTLTSSAGFFVAADIGRYITCQGTPYQESWKIVGFTSATSVTVDRAASVAHTAQLCAVNGITGSITVGSSLLTVNAANLTANDIGRTVYVPAAGAAVGTGKIALKSVIAAVSGTSITLADNAANTATNVPVILSPAVEIIAANDMVIDTLNMAFNSGTSLVLSSSVDLRLVNSKIVGMVHNSPYFGQTNQEADFAAAFFFSHPVIDNITIEEMMTGGLGRVLISGSRGGLSIGATTGTLQVGVPQYALIANDVNSGFSFGPINTVNQVDPAWLEAANLVYNDGTSNYGALTLGPVTSYNSGPPVPQYTRPDIRTVATLPACNAAAKYTTASVSDQSGVPTYRGALTGGGALAVLAYCNGATWEAH